MRLAALLAMYALGLAGAVAVGALERFSGRDPRVRDARRPPVVRMEDLEAIGDGWRRNAA